VGKNGLSQHVMGFLEFGNELSVSVRCGQFLSYLSNFCRFKMNSCSLEPYGQLLNFFFEKYCELFESLQRSYDGLIRWAEDRNIQATCGHWTFC